MTPWSSVLLLHAAVAAEPAGPSLRVAAVHDTGRLAAETPGCAPDDRLCRLVGWVDAAAEQGARLFVAPEYVLKLDRAAAPLQRGQAPGPGHVLAPLAAAADRHDLTVVFALWMRDAQQRDRNAQVVLAPDGTVAAVHHKIELFAGERAWATPGDDVQVVEVDGHRVGLLICADLYGEPALHARLVDTLGAQLVTVSAEWTAAGAARWGAAFAHDWSVPVVFSNTGHGDGVGSGIFAAGGGTLVQSGGTETELLVADVPLRPPTSPSTPRPTPDGSER